MLDQQFFHNPDYSRYLTGHFVLYRADSADESGQAVFERFDVSATPCVLIALAEGAEVDRVIGFDVPPSEYLKLIDRVRRGENTLRNLLQALEKNPGDPGIAATLARKYQERFAFARMRSFSEIVLRRPAGARRVLLPFGKDGAEVNAYEYARYTSAYVAPGNILDFLTEFPESPMRDAAFGNLDWYLTREESKEEALAVYEELLKRWPEEPGLLIPLIKHYGQSPSPPEEALQYAQSLWRFHPDRFDAALRGSYAALLLKAGDHPSAQDVYGPGFAAQILREGDYRPLNDYAWFWATRGCNLESALTAAQRALALRDAANIWDTLSMVYRKQGRLGEALNAEERAVQLSEGRVRTYVERLEEIRREMRSGRGGNP